MESQNLLGMRLTTLSMFMVPGTPLRSSVDDAFQARQLDRSLSAAVRFCPAWIKARTRSDSPPH